MPIITITAPAAEPVTTAEVKAAARIDDSNLDSQISILISAFRQQAEHKQERRLITQTVELVLDEFPASNEINLILPDAQSVTSVKYLDTAGAEQTLSTGIYALDVDSTPSRLLLKYDQEWPYTQDVPNSVRIRYVVGYGAASTDVPNNTRQWIIAQVCAALDGKEPFPWLDRLLDAGIVHHA